MNTAIFSNVNQDLLIKMVKKKQTVFFVEGYGQWISYALERDDRLAAFQPKVILLLLDGNALLEGCSCYQDGKEEIERQIGYVRRFAQNYSECMLAVSTLDILPKRICSAAAQGSEALWEADWIRALQALTAEFANVVPFPLKELLTREGRRNVYSNKMWYMGAIPYNMKATTVLAESINEFVRKLEMTRKKVLVIDLDNTIWGGVAGEDGPDGITLGESLAGAVYRDTQKRIREIGQTGILLAVVSKNNPEDVNAVFEKNSFMVLKKKDFVSIQANWNPKAQNIRALAESLNLGLDSFVFLDDNEVEREAVKIALPEVTIVDFPTDIAELPEAVSELYKKYFWCWRETGEDRVKTLQYQQEAQRKQDLASAGTMEEYLKSLQIRIVLQEVQDAQIQRAVQLLNKTNQFNTNTLRLDMQQFLQYRTSPNHHIYVANVSDRYGDSGLVAELLLREDGQTACIDEFLMSCRVMGRQIEDAVVSAVADSLAERGIQTVRSSYLKSEKNKPVETLWDRLGFTVLHRDGAKTLYELKLPTTEKPLLEVQWNV